VGGGTNLKSLNSLTKFQKTIKKFEMFWGQGGGSVVLNKRELMTSLSMLGGCETRASILNIPKLPRESSLGV
jgi:hypothetical protein